MVVCDGMFSNQEYVLEYVSTFHSAAFTISFLLLCPLQVCDKEWHHYVLNVEFPTVSLFVDGNTFEPFLVTEDYPLHNSKIETQLTIGACWQGRFLHFLRNAAKSDVTFFYDNMHSFTSESEVQIEFKERCESLF